MNISKIQSASIKMGEMSSNVVGGDPTVVTLNGVEYPRATLNEAISAALSQVGEPSTPKNIAEFIEVATKGFPAEAYSPPAKKRQRKPCEKKQDESKKPTFVGKLYTDKEGTVYEVIEEIPPTDWRFTLIDLRWRIESGLAEAKIVLNLKQFKELSELVPKRKGKLPRAL